MTFAVKIQKAEPFKRLAHFQVKNRVKVCLFLTIRKQPWEHSSKDDNHSQSISPRWRITPRLFIDDRKILQEYFSSIKNHSKRIS